MVFTPAFQTNQYSKIEIDFSVRVLVNEKKNKGGKKKGPGFTLSKIGTIAPKLFSLRILNLNAIRLFV